MVTYRSFTQQLELFRRGFGRTAARPMMAALASVALCSCAVISDPYIAPSPTDPPIDPSFDAATDYAFSKANEMNEKLKELESYDFATGSIIFASGIAGIGFGAYGAHADALIGAGLAGSTAYGARSYLPIQDRKIIYETGSSAITCAITALSLGELTRQLRRHGVPQENWRSLPLNWRQNPTTSLP